jgi:hypothetical protein
MCPHAVLARTTHSGCCELAQSNNSLDHLPFPEFTNLGENEGFGFSDMVDPRSADIA